MIQHGINLGVNNNKEVLIEMVDSNVVVLSFGFANIVKDADVEKFSVVYGPKEEYFDVFDNLSYFGEDTCRALPIFKRLLAEIQHPVFISLVRLSSGKHR